MEERLNTYEDCVNALNTLSTSLENSLYEKQLGLMEGFLNRVGLPLEKLDQLSVIHIAGTKGKGSTCAFTERILRQCGLKTGFSSGPPLIEVRERFRIGGLPISRAEFQTYFKQVYIKLKTTAQKQHHQDEEDMPNYRCFIFILAFVIFIDKKVDVAIIEVGIGGMYDGSNVLRNVPVVGITTLDLDHMSLLGSTIAKIAEHKAGIMKKNCQAFTVTQLGEAMTVLKKQSDIKNCQIKVVNGLNNFNVNFGIAQNTWKLNASLAVELAKAWLSYQRNIDLNDETIENALEACYWPGRFEVRHRGHLSYYLDCAHTEGSLKIAIDWFVKHTKESQKKRVLMFNITGDRVAKKLLKPFLDCNFNLVIFVPHIPRIPLSADLRPYGSQKELLIRCEENKQAWKDLQREYNDTIETSNCLVYQTIEDAIEDLKNDQNQYDVFVTGSVRLVGGVFSIIDPGLNDCLQTQRCFY